MKRMQVLSAWIARGGNDALLGNATDRIDNLYLNLKSSFNQLALRHAAKQLPGDPPLRSLKMRSLLRKWSAL
jgi:hypothetical protein